jgi:hypothetical protein
VRQTLGLLEADPHDPRLHTYEYRTLRGANGEKVFESYADTKAAGTAHRVFWQAGPMAGYLTVLAITPYP